MRTGPDASTRATREYQHTNRRGNKFTRRRHFTSCPLSVEVTSKKIEEGELSPVDNFSAISASHVRYGDRMTRFPGRAREILSRIHTA
jgi:hypothetical protein